MSMGFKNLRSFIRKLNEADDEPRLQRAKQKNSTKPFKEKNTPEIILNIIDDEPQFSNLSRVQQDEIVQSIAQTVEDTADFNDVDIGDLDLDNIVITNFQDALSSLDVDPDFDLTLNLISL